MAWSRYQILESECEKLVSLLNEHGLLTRLLEIDPDLCDPSMFRSHGEYGVWVEQIYDMLIEHELPIPSDLMTQITTLADRMEIRGRHIP